MKKSVIYRRIKIGIYIYIYIEREREMGHSRAGRIHSEKLMIELNEIVVNHSEQLYIYIYIYKERERERDRDRAR